jgi:poly-gamma-glutamate capsule biosynthesis protein CapA/YwtB (metallophosphatase superfamily)
MDIPLEIPSRFRCPEYKLLPCCCLLNCFVVVTGVEVFQGKLIMYGCGEFIDDYEGIAGYESFRGDLSLMFSAEVDPATGRLSALVMTPIRIRHLRVDKCREESDIEWLRSTMSRECRSFGCDVKRVGNKLRLVFN